jgi:hypothetical protein
MLVPLPKRSPTRISSVTCSHCSAITVPDAGSLEAGHPHFVRLMDIAPLRTLLRSSYPVNAEVGRRKRGSLATASSTISAHLPLEASHEPHALSLSEQDHARRVLGNREVAFQLHRIGRDENLFSHQLCQSQSRCPVSVAGRTPRPRTPPFEGMNLVEHKCGVLRL